MMKISDSKSIGFAAALGCAILLLCLTGAGYCEDDGTALMLEMSPVNGGTLNLSPGVHTYDRDAEVTLIATPKPGYQFVYWLGNVTNATTSTTAVYLDSPKIVIAVFERSKFEFVEPEEELQGSAGGGGLIPSGSDYAAGLEQAGGGKRPPEPPKPNEDVPVPEEEPNFPVPVPEPATVAFLFAGMLMLIKYPRRRARLGPALGWEP
jgi:hypothetical protein